MRPRRLRPFIPRRILQVLRAPKRRLYAEVGSMLDNIRCCETEAEVAALEAAVEGATGMSAETTRKCRAAIDEARARISGGTA